MQANNVFEAFITWQDSKAGLLGRDYLFQQGDFSSSVNLLSLKDATDAQTPLRQLDPQRNYRCTLALHQALPDTDHDCAGPFVLLDPGSQQLIASGQFQHRLRRSDNIHPQAVSILRPHRETLNGHPGKVIWFTGLSGAGKSTLANALEQALYARGCHTYLLDGDNVRHGLNKDLGFSEADRVENIRRVAEVARLMLDAGLIVLTAFISPFRQDRETARQCIGAENFIEVYVATPLEICEQRDPKGLYKKARRGELPNLTGIGSPYEAPLAPDVLLRTDHASLTEMIDTLLAVSVPAH